MKPATPDVKVVNTLPEHFASVIEMCREVYPDSVPWNEKQLASHLEVFPEGQFVAVEPDSNRVVGMAASLIVLWDDYDFDSDWHDLTEHGTFTNHDPEAGHTLYGAEIMVHPGLQGRGIGKEIYRARRELTERLKLLRIRAGARLRSYHRYADRMSAVDYVHGVVKGEIGDPTLSFQLRQDFHVLAVVKNYLRKDSESLGYAAVIEWINEAVAKPEDYAGRRNSPFSDD
jgi:ribosomal protein S18 acetylase RimI-like enzyme